MPLLLAMASNLLHTEPSELTRPPASPTPLAEVLQFLRLPQQPLRFHLFRSEPLRRALALRAAALAVGRQRGPFVALASERPFGTGVCFGVAQLK